MRFPAFALALLLLTVSLAGPGSPVPAARAQDASLDWEDCGSSTQCATLEVPLDYSRPDGPKIELALVRRPASNPSQRIGSLLVNPGGPGGSGLEFARLWASILDKDIRDRFDIVGFDPRGVGESSPLVCHDNLQEYIAADPSPDDQEEWDTLEAETRELAENCADEAGEAIDFYGTKNVARDLDRIREALGDDKLTYVGYSYGTEIGQVYAQLFPGNIRAIVLDGAVDLSLPTDDLVLGQAIGFERALENFIANCDESGDRCDLNDYGGAEEAIADVLEMAEEEPIPSEDADRPAGPGEVLLGIITPLYNRFTWGNLESAVADALDGDGSRLVELADSYLGRHGEEYQNITEMNIAVNCIDDKPSQLPTDFEDYPEAAKRFAERSPLLGPALATGLSCEFWAGEVDPIEPPENTGAPPMLVVSTTGDPATPYEWGVAVAEQLGNAVLLTYRGDGHTVYGGQDACVDAAVNAYLLELELPEDGTECGDGPPPPDANAPADPDEDDDDPRDSRDNPRNDRDENDRESRVANQDANNTWFVFGMVVIAVFVAGAAGVVIYGVARKM